MIGHFKEVCEFGLIHNQVPVPGGADRASCEV